MDRPPVRSRRRLIKWLAFFVLLGLAIWVLSGCYLFHVAKGQLTALCDAESVDEALKRPDLEPCDKDKIVYIQDVREFAETKLTLKPSDNYTTYLPGSKEPRYWVLTAAYKDRLEPITWTFPVVGTVSYKGFFDLEVAKKARDELAADGYDVYLRPALAYSTLGWFKDPITPQMLDLDAGLLADLIIHELTHGTVYAAGQTTYSEFFAQFVGRQGALEFLADRYGQDSAEVAAFRDRVADEQLFDGFMRDAAVRLRAMYAAKPADLEAARQAFFDGMRADYLALRPRFRTAAYAGSELGTLNNASMAGRLAYADTVPFERAFAALDGSWLEFVALVKQAAETEDPFRALRDLAGQPKGGSQ